MYIWQEGDWPCFTWDDDFINPSKTQVVEAAARLEERLGALDEAGRDAFRLSMLEDEVIASSLIEGVRLDHNDAHAGPASIVQDAQDNHDSPLTKTRLLGWHHQLFPDGISEGRRIRTGAWRQGPVYVVSGHMGMEVIHFEAPPAKVFDALWSGDDDKLTDVVSQFLFRTISYYDYKEDYYHAFLAGLLTADGYDVKSNMATGTGRADIVIFDDSKRRAAVIEVKRSSSYEGMEKDVQKAIAQIKERQYGQDFTDYTTVLKYGAAFFGKSVIFKSAE